METFEKSFRSKTHPRHFEPLPKVDFVDFFNENFFSNASKNFLWVVGPRWRYLEGVFDLADYFSKKIGLIRHFNQNILKKTCWGGKNHAFFAPPWSRSTKVCTTWSWLIWHNLLICTFMFSCIGFFWSLQPNTIGQIDYFQKCMQIGEIIIRCIKFWSIL